MSKRVTHAEILKRLRSMCDTAGTQSAVADHLGITRAYLSDILSERRDPGPRVLRALGLRKIPPARVLATYEPV